ncbi:MAG: phosphatidylglycerophosphatase A [Pyrinomonadaceae bacterium]
MPQIRGAAARIRSNRYGGAKPPPHLRPHSRRESDGCEDCTTRMGIKESSDELNPTAIAADPPLAAPPSARSAKDYLALAIATCGVGYLPLAPGTWGSLLAVGIYLLIRTAILHHPADTPSIVGPSGFLAGELIAITAVTLLGIWAASRTERILQVKDPGKVVVDEVAGQWIALLPVPLTRIGPWPVWVFLAFLLFRCFDIVKPYPVRRLEGLESGLGVMADDLAAGAYAAIVIAVLIALFAKFVF